jgi:Spy/CpxP family protein refolding chaperone
MKIRTFSLVAALALGSLLACTTIASAQDTPAPKKGKGPSVERQLERMTTELKLTDDQKPKVKAVLEDSNKKRQELFADSSVTGDDRRTKMRAIMDDQDKKLKEILTADQYKSWEKLRDEMRQRRGGQGGQGGQGGGEKKAN